MEILSSKASHSSNSSQTLIRSHARHNNAHTSFDAGSTTEKKTSVASSNATTTERKRKSDVPVPAQNDERKRIKRTVSTTFLYSKSHKTAPQISNRFSLDKV